MNDQPDPARRPIDPSLFRGLTQRRYSRRDMLRYAGYGVGSAGLAAFLAACGVKGAAPKASPTKPGASPSAIDFTKFYGDGKPAGTLNFANWEAYIDVDSKGNSPSLQAFTKQTGIKVNYLSLIHI